MAIKTLGKEYRNESEAIRALQSELSRIEEQQQARQEEVMKDLPEQVGLSSVDELIRALAEHASPAVRKKILGSAVRKKRARKKSARKSAAKKGARKTTAKKATRKKRATKKGAAKKGAAKKGATKKTAAKKGARKRSRAQVTEETVAKMKEAFDNKVSGAKIAKQFGVSLSTVHNVKKRLGLVKS